LRGVGGRGIERLMRVLVTLLTLTAASTALAQKPAPLVGVKEVVRFTTPAGFIDDAVATDDTRIAYAVADAAAKAELHVVTLATGVDQVVDLAPITLHPIALELVGPRVLVVGLGEDGAQTAALVELAKGKIVYKLPAATQIAPITRDGKRVVAVHRATGTRHEVELVALDSGRRLAAGRPLELDASGASHALDFRVNHWSDGMTRAYGIKGGEWNPKENQRTPDVEATYDLVTGRFVDQHPIADLFEQRKRYQQLADAGGKLDFARMSHDSAAIAIWRAGTPRTIELDQPVATYDPKSLQGIVAADGSAWLILKVDPVNPDAVARKKADPEYLDVFRVGTDTRATRKGRILAPGIRHRFGVIGDRFWLVERNTGFERGGKALVIYAFE
jgi:hypothetical protein